MMRGSVLGEASGLPAPRRLPSRTHPLSVCQGHRDPLRTWPRPARGLRGSDTGRSGSRVRHRGSPSQHGGREVSAPSCHGGADGRAQSQPQTGSAIHALSPPRRPTTRLLT